MEQVKDRGVKRSEKSNGQVSVQEKYYNQFREFILENNHPCLMAQAVFKSSNATLKVYEKFDEMGSTQILKDDLEEFANTCGDDDDHFQSFVAVFPDFRIYDEVDFEKLLWKRLQTLHNIDVDYDWDPSVSSNPDECNFSFSVAGKAFYVIGMHPESSRISRQAPVPTMIFNLHRQFEKLRENGVYEDVRNKIRERDYMVQGSLNPMIADFGTSSEARQYSGRSVEEDWKCPFVARV